MSGIRTFTDNHFFGNNPSQRNIVQAATRDVSHGFFHLGGFVGNCLQFRFDRAGRDFSRAVSHFSGENIRQIGS